MARCRLTSVTTLACSVPPAPVVDPPELLPPVVVIDRARGGELVVVFLCAVVVRLGLGFGPMVVLPAATGDTSGAVVGDGADDASAGEGASSVPSSAPYESASKAPSPGPAMAPWCPAVPDVPTKLDGN